MHSIKVDDSLLRTDLIIDQNKRVLSSKTIYKNHLKIDRCMDKNYSYSTIHFKDITDKNDYLNLEKCFLIELKRILSPRKNDIYLIIGLGNENSTPDSLGPKVLDHILVTRPFYLMKNVDSNYSNVSIFKPNVIGNTGIESISIIKKIIQEIKPTKVIVIDALKANDLSRLIKTIQITNSGIHPGSGIFNNRGEISYKTVGCDVIAIGIPTVVDIHCIANTKDSFIVTPTNIDFVIEELSQLIGESINLVLHKNLRQISN